MGAENTELNAGDVFERSESHWEEIFKWWAAWEESILVGFIKEDVFDLREEGVVFFGS